MEYKTGQEVWVKGAIVRTADVVFKDKNEELIGYIGETKLKFATIRTDDTPTIPKFVAEYIIACKGEGVSLFDVMDDVISEGVKDVCDWLMMHNNDETFARAWLDGYEIEQEKLYTVEIPNPNRKGNNRFFLHKNPHTGEISLCKGNFNPDKNKNLWLTESEIKQDFAWAWDAGFAKEVE